MTVHRLPPRNPEGPGCLTIAQFAVEEIYKGDVDEIVVYLHYKNEAKDIIEHSFIKRRQLTAGVFFDAAVRILGAEDG